MTKYEIAKGSGRINGIANDDLTAPLKRNETRACRNCTFSGGEVCNIHTPESRAVIARVVKKEGSIPLAVQALASRGDIPLQGRGQNVEVDCPGRYIQANLKIVPEATESKLVFGFDAPSWTPPNRRSR